MATVYSISKRSIAVRSLLAAVLYKIQIAIEDHSCSVDYASSN